MTDSLGDILKNRSSRSKEPEEFQKIRTFVQAKYHITPKVSVSKSGVQIHVPNAGIAGNLRFDLYELQQLVKTKRRIIIRISQ